MFFFDDENNNSFQEIRRIDENGKEFWYARELQEVLEYTEWRNFSKVIDKARISCKTSGEVETSHFVDGNKMVESGVADIRISQLQIRAFNSFKKKKKSVLIQMIRFPWIFWNKNRLSLWSSCGGR